MSRIIPLEISYDFNGHGGTIYPAIAWDEKEMILIDCGFPGFLKSIEKKAQSKGLDLNNLTRIILTHHDYDHIGSLADFKKKYPRVKIYSSSIEKEYINGDKKMLRVSLAEEKMDDLPEEEKDKIIDNNARLNSVARVEVDEVLKDKDEFDWCGGMEIIATPGHMPGHICIYFKEMKTAVTGDAISIINGKLANPDPVFTLDMELANKSLRKLLNYDIKRLITYHWGVYDGDVIEEIDNSLKL